MIEVLPETHDNVLGFRVEGKLTDADYRDVLIPRFEHVLSSHGKARVLLDMGVGFHGWQPAAVWDDAVFGLKHRNDFEKLAVVGGPQWMAWATRLGAHFMSGELKTFSADQRGEAWDWINGS